MVTVAPMHIGQLTKDEVYADLHTRQIGLSSVEATNRLREFGPNRFERVKRTHPSVLLFREVTHFFAIVLWVAAGLAYLAGEQDPTSGMQTLAVAIVLVILINGIFSFWQEYRSDKAVRILETMLPRKAKVMRDNNLVELPTDDIVPGDILELEAGDQVPADSRLVEAISLRADTSALTGESVPASLISEPVENALGTHSPNVALAGMAIVAGRGRAVVFATGPHTSFAGIAQLTRRTTHDESPLQKEIRRVSRALALLSAILGLVFFIAGRARGLSLADSFLFGIGILVANVPEGLLPTVTLSLAMSSQRMAKRNALVRHLPAIEAIGAASCVCTDKTGTLTLNQMQVAELQLASGNRLVRWQLDNDISSIPQLFSRCLVMCHDLRKLDSGVLVGDPMELALVALGQKAYPENQNDNKIAEIPFDTRRKRQSVIIGFQNNTSVHMYLKGATESVLALCSRGYSISPKGELSPIEMDDGTRNRVIEEESRMAGRGLRVIALAYRELPADPLAYENNTASVELERDLVFLGLVGLRDPPRPGVANAIASCATARIRVIMVTGDHPLTAAAIARELRLLPDGVNGRFIKGTEVSRLSDTALQLLLSNPHIHFARMSPEEKTRVVQALRRRGEVVAVTGDGVNDAPALKAADVGIAMGKNGTDVAREVSSIVLLDDNFATIVAAIEEGRAVFDNIRKFLVYILTSNIPELIPYIAFVLLGIPLPLTIIQVLAVDLGTDMVPALALGAEAPADDIMQRPPRKKNERLLSTRLLLRAYVWLGLLEATASMFVFFWVLHEGGWVFGQPLSLRDPLYIKGTTACLMSIVVCQIANVMICKSPRRTLSLRTMFNNRTILLGIAVELSLMLFIAYSELGNKLFGTAPLSPQTWAIAAGCGLVMLLVEELRKRIFARSQTSQRV